MSEPLNEGNGDSDDAAEITIREMDLSNLESNDQNSPKAMGLAFGDNAESNTIK